MDLLWLQGKSSGMGGGGMGKDEKTSESWREWSLWEAEGLVKGKCDKWWDRVAADRKVEEWCAGCKGWRSERDILCLGRGEVRTDTGEMEDTSLRTDMVEAGKLRARDDVLPRDKMGRNVALVVTRVSGFAINVSGQFIYSNGEKR